MLLSIIIVNYNVKYFLEQCLSSVYNSTGDFDLEVFVVDNASVDDSVAMVREKFPQVKVIANDDNVGFARANNQALKVAKGDYLLLLNPDTLVEPNTFEQCIHFMQEHPDCGGLGVKMINGEGKFLKESKRGFPTPATSFYKISGLIRLFPHNKKIAAYYMGHLPEDETNEIEILPGAYIMLSRAAFEKVGYLDEDYFMYGEDIDFSWRIRLAGFKNYYLPSARIIHYKGESTKKGSMNYVYTFYNAMAIFARKYFSGKNARIYNITLQLAIWFRAGLSFFTRLCKRIAVPLLDFVVLFAGFFIIKNLWATYKGAGINYYPYSYTWVVIPIYILLLMLGMFLCGGYDKPMRIVRNLRGLGIGALLLLVFYSLLDETQRYSRMVILLGSVWSVIGVLGIRGVLNMLGVEGYATVHNEKRKCLIVGENAECQRVQSLLSDVGISFSFIGCVSVAEARRLSELIHYYRADEVIFCSQDVPPQEIITMMSSLQSSGVEYKIVPPESDFIIGSNSINSSEDLYTIDLNTIASPTNQRNKRIFDILSAMLLICLTPILIWFQKKPSCYLRDCFRVLVGKQSWVGYEQHPGVFSPHDITSRQPDNATTQRLRQQINLRYARNYQVTTDMLIVWRNLSRI